MSQLKKKTLGLIARIQEKLPEQRVGLVPADAFFVRKVELPEGLTGEDSAAFIQLDLEGNSPFPMDQLAWGYLQHSDSPHAFVYATPMARLRRLEVDSVEKYFQLFPGFVTLFGDPVERSCTRFISQNGVISALFLKAGQSVPQKIVSRPIEGELLTDDVQLKARQALADSLGATDYPAEEGLWLGEKLEILSDGSIRFTHRHLSTERSLGLKDHVLKLPGSALWAIDLRGAAYAAVESTNRQRSSLIWKSLKAGTWVAILLILLQFGNFGLKGFNLLLQKKIADIEPYAIRVENKLTLATRLTQSTEEDLKPFVLMEAINPLRPDSIFFERVRSQAYDTLEIEGKSTEGVTPVNAFADSVGQLPYVASVENNSQTRNNQTSFDFVITFSEIPPGPEGGFVIQTEPDATDTEGGEQ